MSKFFLNIFLLCFIASFCQGAKILFFFGGGSYSHKSSVWAWATELANRGHEVTFLSPYEKKPTDFKNPNLRDVSSKDLNRLMAQTYTVDRFSQREAGAELDGLQLYSPLSVKLCQIMLQSEDPVLQTLVYNETFDLVVVNSIFGECGFILANHYKAKTIVFNSCTSLPWLFDVYKFQAQSWLPDVLSQFQNFPLSYMDRVSNTYSPLYWYWERYNNISPHLEDLMKEAFGLIDVPSFEEMERNTSLVFVNSHPAIDFAYTLPPMIQMVGGISTFLPENPIPQKYQDFMDESGSKGVVLISFGSSVDLDQVPVFYQKLFFDLVKKYEDVRFLLKWKGPLPKGFEGGLNNLMVSDWLPQRELLRHPKLRAFVTHGGLNSIQEATFYGVPLIVMPLFADQDYNAIRIQAQDVGLILEIRGMNFAKLDYSVQTVLYNPKYKKNMEIKSKIFRDQPQSPLENVIYWTEFVLRHDTTSLKPMSSHLNWFQLRSIDVYLLCFLILISLPILILVIVYKILKSILKTPKATRKIKSS